MGIGRFIRKTGGVVAKISRSPLGKVAGMVPGLGTVVSGVGLATSAYGAYKGIQGIRGNQGVPAMGAMPGGLPPLPGVQGKGGRLPMVMPGKTGGFGIPRGPGGRMQLPWNDPSVPAFLKQFSLDDSAIKLCMRAPKGYVIIRDPDGQPYPVLRKVAIQFGLWKPAKKPLISVRDTSAIKHAASAIKRLKKFAVKMQAVDHATTNHGKVFIKKKKGH